ncbi:class I SAM-dependent methyltransferase [Ensifer sp. BR816]|uniref:class I SAM-dependent methyltransferase n=1 Tax=Rhizobium sp. (strain BR816) TaxID=1057002 RepID=UPI00037FE0B3|nr:class I SAM-dependent methyltransferase [Ensifer sp. BR816]
MNVAHRRNHDLKEDIRTYWSQRSKTFDLAFGHKIADGPEFDAWAAAIRKEIGDRPLKVLELACGTGEITRVLLSLSHEVTALDFSEAMLVVARAKHNDNPNVRFILADAENTMEPDACYDAVVCRHLVWTLIQPAQAFADWHRVLRPGGRLLFFDGDWATPTRLGRMASGLIWLMERVIGHDPHYDGAMGERHASIMQRLPFGSGLSPVLVVPMLERAGFDAVRVISHDRVARGQRARANLRNKLRTIVYRKFVIGCIKT